MSKKTKLWVVKAQIHEGQEETGPMPHEAQKQPLDKLASKYKDVTEPKPVISDDKHTVATYDKSEKDYEQIWKDNSDGSEKTIQCITSETAKNIGRTTDGRASTYTSKIYEELKFYDKTPEDYTKLRPPIVPVVTSEAAKPTSYKGLLAGLVLIALLAVFNVTVISTEILPRFTK